jgi:hypothetical protein
MYRGSSGTEISLLRDSMNIPPVPEDDEVEEES